MPSGTVKDSQTQGERLKKVIVAVLKISVSVLLLAYLVHQARSDGSFRDLSEQPKHWGMLAMATLAALASVSLTFARWCWLARGVNVEFSYKDAFRLGFLGYLFNFLSVGIIGGDVLKAVVLAKQQPGRRTAVVASVILDRMIGLYAMFVVAAVAFAFVDFNSLHVRDPKQLDAVKRICDVTLVVTVGGICAAIVLTLFPITHGKFWERVYQLPVVGGLLKQVLEAVRLYQARKILIVASTVVSFLVHALSTLSVYLVAQGLPGGEPTLGMHFVIVPISLVAGAAPVPGGLGAFEFCLDFLYRAISPESVAERQGFLIALAYRAITMLIAAIGLGYYFASRREVGEALLDAKQSNIEPAPMAQSLPASTAMR